MIGPYNIKRTECGGGKNASQYTRLRARKKGKTNNDEKAKRKKMVELTQGGQSDTGGKASQEDQRLSRPNGKTEMNNKQAYVPSCVVVLLLLFFVLPRGSKRPYTYCSCILRRDHIVNTPRCFYTLAHFFFVCV